MAVTIVSLLISILSLVTGILKLDDTFRLQMFVVSGVALIVFLISLFISKRKESHLKVYSKRQSISLEEELGDASEIWLAWHTGSVKVAEGDLFNSPRRIRLILTHPESSALKEVAKIANSSLEKLSTDIRELSQIVNSNGGEVRWFDGLIGNSVIIIDPESDNAWARIEAFIPFIESAARPSIKCLRKNKNGLFINLKKSYETIWESSQKLKTS